MKNFKKSAYSSLGLGLLAGNSLTTFAGFDGKKGSQASTITRDGNLIDTVELWINLLLGLLMFVAVVYGLWGGFNILTAAGDEEKVKKGKTVLINAIIGIVVIFMVGLIIRFVMGLVQDDTIGG